MLKRMSIQWYCLIHPDLFLDHPNENILQGDAANSTKDEQSPPASQLSCETSVEVEDFLASPR